MRHPLMSHRTERGDIRASEWRRWCRLQIVLLGTMPFIVFVCANALLSFISGDFQASWLAIFLFMFSMLAAVPWAWWAFVGLWRMPTVIIACGLYADAPDGAAPEEDDDTNAIDRAVA